jgi:hypothetical protein
MRYAFASLLFVLGCSSTSGTSESPPAPPAAVPPPAAPPGTENPPPPAAPVRPDVRQLTKLSGPVMTKPVVVPIFWGDDPDRERTEQLLASLPGSSYWQLLQEYGVGDISIAPSVTVAATSPASYSLNDVESTISAFTAANDGTQIYALMLPKTTTVTNTDGSPFCNAGLGYHMTGTQGGSEFIYAVNAHCGGTFDGFAVTVTHELMEAATDPYPLTNPAWAGTDAGHIGFRGEIGDLCDFGGSLTGMGAPLFGTRVERVFSNAKAAKGGDPCAPDVNLPYFVASPVPSDDVTVSDFILGPTPGRGVRVPVGKSKTIPLVLHADRTVPAWTVGATTITAGTFQPSDAIKATVDKTHGAAGDVLTLTIERIASSGDTGDVVLVTSKGATAQWFDTLCVTE